MAGRWVSTTSKRCTVTIIISLPICVVNEALPEVITAHYWRKQYIQLSLLSSTLSSQKCSWFSVNLFVWKMALMTQLCSSCVLQLYLNMLAPIWCFNIAHWSPTMLSHKSHYRVTCQKWATKWQVQGPGQSSLLMLHMCSLKNAWGIRYLWYLSAGLPIKKAEEDTRTLWRVWDSWIAWDD